MKKYSSNKAQKGKTAYRTPSRWRASRPEGAKRNRGVVNDFKHKIERLKD